MQSLAHDHQPDWLWERKDVWRPNKQIYEEGKETSDDQNSAFLNSLRNALHHNAGRDVDHRHNDKEEADLYLWQLEVLHPNRENGPLKVIEKVAKNSGKGCKEESWVFQ